MFAGVRRRAARVATAGDGYVSSNNGRFLRLKLQIKDSKYGLFFSDQELTFFSLPPLFFSRRRSGRSAERAAAQVIWLKRD